MAASYRSGENPGSRETDVLVVDDEEQLRKLAQRALTKAGLRVQTAASGEEAMAILNQGKRFDTIVSDLMMPGMGGMEFLREVRNVDLDVPLIFLTGKPSLETAMAAMEHGGYRYLSKPLEHEKLIAAVKDAAAHHRLALLKRKALEICEAGGWLIEDLEDLDGRFQRALDKLWVAYQPIVLWPERQIFGYEALLRSSDEDLSTPGKLFDAAERLGRVQELGKQVREAIALSAASAPAGALVFANLHALDLTSDDLYSLHSPLAALAERVVLEVTERASLHRVEHLRERIERLRDIGFRIAVDDLGASHAGLSSFAQLGPDIVKLDMSLVRDVDSSASKANLIKSMIALCTKELGMRVVCEGVESEAERDTLSSIGADLLQGYLFGMPSRGFRRESELPQPVVS
jgi:EAL domain-containing protein (putative c-di-GMP-specific phosphodiesterase class I)